MKKSADERFEQELREALRGQMQAPERNAARARVSRRLQESLSQLGTGAAAALPLLLEAPPAAASGAAAAASSKALAAASGAAASSKALAAASVAGGASLGAGASGAAGAGVGAAAAHPLGAWLVAFALGAGAGGGVLVAATAGRIWAPSSASQPSAPNASASSGARHGLQRAVNHAPVQATSESVRTEPVIAPSVSQARGETPSNALPLPRAPLAAPPGRSAGLGQPETSEPNRPAAPLTGSLTEQQALLDRARSALSHGDGGQALAALAEHARAHPTSELAEERDALTIKSLIRASDYAKARELAAAFIARYPHSLFLPSIRAALAQNP
ncbi:MAG TPA: outer membrane protein assembly factor BamD [Polyangiaceae bacterium]|jgi:hypothetical protein|nr:outer membrane protein assembly factor BamD [Polyangiaceae bacterium]